MLENYASQIRLNSHCGVQNSEVKMSKGFRIERIEIKKRFGYILLGIFGFYLVSPIRDWLDANISFNPLIIGIVGIILTLYFFDFS